MWYSNILLLGGEFLNPMFSLINPILICIALFQETLFQSITTNDFLEIGFRHVMSSYDHQFKHNKWFFSRTLKISVTLQACNRTTVCSILFEWIIQNISFIQKISDIQKPILFVVCSFVFNLPCFACFAYVFLAAGIPYVSKHLKQCNKLNQVCY